MLPWGAWGVGVELGVRDTPILSVQSTRYRTTMHQPWGAWGLGLELGVLDTPILSVQNTRSRTRMHQPWGAWGRSWIRVCITRRF